MFRCANRAGANGGGNTHGGRPAVNADAAVNADSELVESVGRCWRTGARGSELVIR